MVSRLLRVALPVKEENGCHGRDRSQKLQHENGRGLAGGFRKMLDQEEKHDGELGAHEQLPDVGGRTFIVLRRRTVGHQEGQDGGKGASRHHQRKKASRVAE